MRNGFVTEVPQPTTEPTPHEELVADQIRRAAREHPNAFIEMEKTPYGGTQINVVPTTGGTKIFFGFVPRDDILQLTAA